MEEKREVRLELLKPLSVIALPLPPHVIQTSPYRLCCFEGRSSVLAIGLHTRRSRLFASRPNQKMLRKSRCDKINCWTRNNISRSVNDNVDQLREQVASSCASCPAASYRTPP